MLVVLVLVASTFSAVAAQGPEPPEGAPQRGLMGRRAPRIFLQVRAVLDKVADVLQLTGEELREALASGRTVAELAEEENVPLDNVTDAVMADVEARLEQFFVEGVPQRSGFPAYRARALALDVVAEMLGMDEAAVREALVDGESVAALAETAGVPLDDVVDALLAEAEERLAQAVADGRLTQDEAAAHLEQLEERLRERIETPLQEYRPGLPMRGGGRRRGFEGDFEPSGPRF